VIFRVLISAVVREIREIRRRGKRRRR